MQNKKVTWILLFMIIRTNYTAVGKVWPLKAIVLNGQNHQDLMLLEKNYADRRRGTENLNFRYFIETRSLMMNALSFLLKLLTVLLRKNRSQTFDYGLFLPKFILLFIKGHFGIQPE